MTTANMVWPTLDELADVEHAFAEAGNKLDVLHLRTFECERALHDTPQGNEGQPTLEEFGALARFVANLELELDSMHRHLREIAGASNAAAHAMPMYPADGRDAR